jgi:hypothetical protein
MARRAPLFALLALALAAALAPASPALAAACPNEAARAEADSLTLPDCRGYELTMPPVKDFPFGGGPGPVAVAARAGGAVAYDTYGPMPGSVAGTLEDFNVARRGPSGWLNTPISAPQKPAPGQGQFPTTGGFSEDVSFQVFGSADPILTPGATPGVANYYMRNTETGGYDLLAASGTEGFAPFLTVGGGSDDFSHVVLEAFEPLTPDAPPTPATSIYDWVGGQLKNAGILPDGTPAPYAIVGGGAGGHGRVINAVSDDGSRIVFSDGLDLYERINDTRTVLLTPSKRTPPDPIGPNLTRFWGASSDGRTAFFTSPEELTEDANTGEDGSGNNNDAGNDLYSFEVDSETLTDLTVDSTPADFETGANVKGVIGNSDDGQYLYFVAVGKLAAGATSGALNLYVAHGSEIKYIGDLASADNGAWGDAQSIPGGYFGLTARVAPNGDLAIQSSAQLTSYDNAGHSEVYRYATGGELTCVSCRPDGSPPLGNATITPPSLETNITRFISDDGSRVFFNSTDAIVPADTNEKTDVYEWSKGEVHLISDGTSPFKATFQDASADGKDVFFATSARLVGQDIDSHEDLYDARVEGGFPAPPPIPPGCVGEACRTGTSAVPGSETAASASFQGAPNPTPNKPRKHKKKSKSRKSKTCKSKPGKKCKSAGKRTANKSGRGK